MGKPTRATRPFMPEYGLLPEDQGDGLMPWSWATERLTANRNYWLSTVTPEGRPHAMPVFAAWFGDALYFSTGGTSKKAINLQSNPNFVITTESAAEPVVLEGTVRFIEDAHTLDALRTVYAEKYGHPFPPDSPVCEVTTVKVIGFVEDAAKFPGSATRWHFD